MSSGENYAKGSSYEWFIRRAWNCDRGKHGAETGYLKVLLDAEEGHSRIKDFDKRYDKVQGYIIKAIDKYLKRKPTLEEKTNLESLRSRVEYSGSAFVLAELVSEGLEITRRYRDL